MPEAVSMPCWSWPSRLYRHRRKSDTHALYVTSSRACRLCRPFGVDVRVKTPCRLRLLVRGACANAREREERVEETAASVVVEAFSLLSRAWRASRRTREDLLSWRLHVRGALVHRTRLTYLRGFALLVCARAGSVSPPHEADLCVPFCFWLARPLVRAA
jgi:hypothetical protein